MAFADALGMTMSSPAYQLISPTTSSLWATYHDIRRGVLFERRGRFGVYDANHPDEFKAHNFPKLLLFGEMPVGVIRIDIEGEIGRFRRVAIKTSLQRQGHGRVLLALSEAFALGRRAVKVEASVAADAVEFYCRCGYQVLKVLDTEGSVRMYKRLDC